MEKLIELLNEYEKENWRNFEVKEIWMTFRNNDLMVISKRYWFIKRLLDNDKIDFDKRPTRNKYRLQQYKTELWWYGKIDEYSELLMLLSISDNPIEDLISYLK
jgi:hypothetical protein